MFEDFLFLLFIIYSALENKIQRISTVQQVLARSLCNSLLSAAFALRPFLTTTPNYLINGGVVKLWYGGGDDKVHSSPSAFSQTWLVAFSPPRMALITTYKKISCEKPNPNAPIDANALKSENCKA